MIENEQQLAELIVPDPPEQSIATISAIEADGIVLDFGKKHYQCNTGLVFSVGQRVLIEKRSGTYVVVCPIGNPSTGSGGNVEYAERAGYADEAGTANTAKQSDSADSADYATVAGAVRSPVSTSQRIQFSVTSGKLAWRVGTNAWTTLQNA